MEQWRELLADLMQGGGVRRSIENVNSWAADSGSIRCLLISPLWRLIPELLAQEIAVIHGPNVFNCMWIETLPSSMQADILTFMYFEFDRFHKRDMELLSQHLLQSSSDFWVHRAAYTLLQKCTGLSSDLHDHGREVRSYLRDYEELPEFLKKYSREAKDTSPEVKDAAQELKDTVPEENLQKIATEMHAENLPEFSEVKSKPAEEILEKASTLRELFRNLDMHAGENIIEEHLGMFESITDLTTAMNIVKPWELEDDVTLYLVTKLLGDNRSYIWSLNVIKAVLLPKLLAELEKPASRILSTAVMKTSKSHSKAFVEAALVPLMRNGVSVVQCELICRIIVESLSSDMVSYLCQQLFCGNYILAWNEAMVMVVNTVLNTKVKLDGAVVYGLLMHLEAASGDLRDSLKFANLLLCMLTKYGTKLAGHKEAVKKLILRTNTFMTKTLLSKAEKL